MTGKDVHRITAIHAQAKNPRRVKIQLDGESEFAITRILAAQLQVGQSLSDERIAALQSADANERAYEQAMLLLSFRARSEAEIRTNLRKHQYSEEQIDEAVGRLREEGYVNDESFARAWVDNRSTFRPRGQRALRAELRRKGLDEESIGAAVAGVDEERLALEAARKRAPRLAGLDWDEYRSKLAGFLLRRGFGYELVSRVADRIWKEMHSKRQDLADKDST